MILKIIKTHKNAIMPTYAHHDDSGMDLFSIEEMVIEPNEYKLVRTGIQIELPEGTEAQIRPRSGFAINNGITVLNTPGTVDEGYRGEIGVVLINHSKDEFEISSGMRIAQMVIAPVFRPKLEQSEDLTITQRGDAGFGSTGTKRK